MMDSSDIKAISTRKVLIERLLEIVESLNNEDIIKIISAAEDISTVQNTKTANQAKEEPQPSTSYASNEIAGESNETQKTNMFGDTKTYDIRGGTINSGREYEVKMITLLSIRCILNKPENMWVATNAKGVGEFDDIICYFKTKGSPGIAYMVQMKHEEAQSEIKEEDLTRRGRLFNLTKHAQGFTKLKETLLNTTGSGDVIENLDPDKIVSVFFTNRRAATVGIPYFKGCTNEDLMLLNTSVKNRHLYKFDVRGGRALSLTNQDYCENIYFLSNQVNETNMNLCIFEEMEKLIKELRLTTINARSIAKEFIEYIAKRAKCKLQKRQYLTQQQVLYKLVDFLLSGYVMKFNDELDIVYDCPNKEIWKKIMNDKKVTYVAFDEVIFNYLKEYVSSEVKKYFDKLRNKNSTLANTNQKSFFIKNSNFETVLGQQESPTIFDVYKYMWVDNKIPLILEINNEKEHQDVLSILNWSKLYLKIVIVKKLWFKLPILLDTKGSFVNLNDLNEEHRNLILHKSVSLQGRKGLKLGELINESMYEFIKCNDIIHILTGNYNIGNNYPSVEYFIERSVYKIVINFEVLNVIKDEFFIIHDRAPEGLLINKLQDLNQNYRTPNLIVWQDVQNEDIIKLKSQYKSIHRLIFYEENWLEWVESQGETKHIKEHLDAITDWHSTICFHNRIHDNVLATNVLNKTHVLSGCPGMGKSTLMDFISNKAPSNMWVLKITLNDHTEHFPAAPFKKASDYIKYFNEKIIKSSFNIPLAEAVFQKLLTENKILVFVDGFDEVSVSYKDETTKMMKSLHESGYYMWISTRPHMNSHLEKEFDTIALTITPFTSEDQQNFFVKYFTEFIQNSKMYKRRINKFSKKLFKAAEKNLNDWECGFMEIPLQCELLADFFINDLRASLSENVINLNEDFNLLQLYQEFINKKRNILYIKYGKYAKDMHKFFDYYQKLLALKILFTNSDLCELDIDLELNDYYQNNRNSMELLQREGVLVLHEKKQTFSATFVHHTFAEFIAAQWLSQNYNSTNSKIKNTAEFLLNKRFSAFCSNRFLYRIFDSLLAKELPLHSAIINKQMSQIKKMLTSSPEEINKLDMCKTSILHLIALYSGTNTNYDYQMVNSGNSIILDQMVDIIEIIPVKQVIDLCGIDTFGYSPVDYALLSNCFPIADKLCEKSNEIMITVGVREYYPSNNFDYAYKSALNKRFQYVVYKCIERELGDNLSFSFTNISSEDRSYLKKLNVITTTDLIEKLNIKSTSEDYYSDLRFAAAFGTLNNVKQLLAKGADVNQRVFGYTSLYCAVKKNRPEIVDILLHEMAEVNETCVDRNTALHAASEGGYGNIVEILIDNGGDVNKRNRFGKTPLFYASERNARNIVNLLLQHRADVNVINIRGNTCLHVVAEKGFQNLSHKFIKYGTDVNIINVNGKTPLFLALEKRHTDVANLLIKEAIKVDTIDYGGNSYLHAAAKADQSYVVSLLLKAGLNVNKRNALHETPLSLALENLHLGVVELLLENNAKIDDVDCFGNTCLHAAAIADHSRVLCQLINAGFDINKQNNDASTPLLLAVENAHISIVKLLLKNNAKIDATDRYGNTCLHAAARTGQSDVVSRLINAGLDINKQNNDGETPLLFAVEYGRISVVKLLLKNNVTLDKVDRYGNTCLHTAARTGQSYIASQLIIAGFDVNKQNNLRETPLSLAVKNGHIDVVELLLKNNAKIDGVDHYGNTYLHAATKAEHKHVVSQLINAGVDVNSQNSTGETSLLIALRYGCLDVAKTLTLCGADFNLLSENNNCHLQYAAHGGCLEDWITFLHMNSYKDTDAKKWDLTVTNKKNQTLLHFSVYEIYPESIAELQDHERTVKFLLSSDIDVNKKDCGERTVLHYISNYSKLRGGRHTDDFYENVATLILNTDIDINAKNVYGETALDLATQRKHYKIASLIRQLLNNVKRPVSNQWKHV